MCYQRILKNAVWRLIAEELGEIQLDPEKLSIIKRVIHTSADFDYARTLHFSNGVVEKALEALKKGATIVTDTNMACVGINKPGLNKLAAKQFALWQMLM